MTTENEHPIIVAFTRPETAVVIQNAAPHFALCLINDAAKMGELDEMTATNQPGERLHGREGQLFAQITAWQPALLLFELENEAIPWARWLALLKSSAATRRIPALVVAPDDGADERAVMGAGADAVYGRSHFLTNLADIIAKQARLPDFEALDEACRQPLPPLVVAGLALFNQGHYYKCHDALEEAWRQDDSAGRDLYRGVLQIGIAYFQIERGNYRGATKMLLRVRQWLDPLPHTCRGIDVAGLRQNATAVYNALIALGPERIDEFDPALFKPVAYEKEIAE